MLQMQGNEWSLSTNALATQEHTKVIRALVPQSYGELLEDECASAFLASSAK